MDDHPIPLDMLRYLYVFNSVPYLNQSKPRGFTDDKFMKDDFKMYFNSVRYLNQS